MSFRFVFQEAGKIITETRTIYDANCLEVLEAYMQARRSHPRARLLKVEQVA